MCRTFCQFLVSCGALISGIGSNTLVITGVEELQSSSPFRISNDFMEEASFMAASFATRGDVVIINHDWDSHHMMHLMFRRLGYGLERRGNDAVANGDHCLAPLSDIDAMVPVIKSSVWPGFNTDLMSVLVVLATQAQGKFMFHETLFDNRFVWTDNLRRMGADITTCDPHRIIVSGPTPLTTVSGGIRSPDIRSGMALVVACLATPGVHQIEHVYQIDRGYEQLDRRLNMLGADIERLE